MELKLSVPDLERAVVEVFGGCNYKCQMCPQTTGRGKEWTRKMPFEMFENILSFNVFEYHIISFNTF